MDHGNGDEKSTEDIGSPHSDRKFEMVPDAR